MARKLKLAVAQCRTLSTTSETINELETISHDAAKAEVDLVLFPEAYLGGYPRMCSFGSSIGAREAYGREQFLSYFKSAVDLGDTPLGAGDDWIDRQLPIAKGTDYRGDGTREALERIAKETGVFIIAGAVEKAGGSLYCSVLYVCPKLGVLGKRRKVMPTGMERLIWAQGSTATLRAVTTTIKHVKLTLAAAICWENYMPLLRYSLYSQNVNLYLAPTADSRDTWLALLRTIATEGRTFVLSGNQCVRRKDLPSWILEPGKLRPNVATNGGTTMESEHNTQGRRRSTIKKTADGKHEICWPDRHSQSPSPLASSKQSKVSQSTAVTEDDPEEDTSSPVMIETVDHHQICLPKRRTSHATQQSADSEQDDGKIDPHDSDFVSRGGSCIISPLGEVLAGPLWKTDGLIIYECDFDDCERGKLDLDTSGHYSRNDSFKLTVEGLDLNPPP